MKYGKIFNKYRNLLFKNKIYIDKKVNNLYNFCVNYKYIKKFIKNIIPINNEYDSNLCCICLSELDKNYITSSCNHRFHYKCYVNLRTKYSICPLCKKGIATSTDYVNDNEKLIIELIVNIFLSIDRINLAYNTILNNINKLINKYKTTTNELYNNIIITTYNCCFFIFYTNHNRSMIIEHINNLDKILKEFKFYNHTAIYKILKKIKKKTNINLDDFVDYLHFRLKHAIYLIV